MIPDKIRTHGDYQSAPVRRFVGQVRRRLGYTGVVTPDIAAGPILQAEINHGRWIARCPFCSGAELVDPADLRFWCLSCDMAGSKRHWLPVQMPTAAARLQVEGLLLKRPQQENRNWHPPGETLADLQAENRAAGVG